MDENQQWTSPQFYALIDYGILQSSKAASVLGSQYPKKAVTLYMAKLARGCFFSENFSLTFLGAKEEDVGLLLETLSHLVTKNPQTKIYQDVQSTPFGNEVSFFLKKENSLF